jgi:hypothetical protein
MTRYAQWTARLLYAMRSSHAEPLAADTPMARPCPTNAIAVPAVMVVVNVAEVSLLQQGRPKL